MGRRLCFGQVPKVNGNAMGAVTLVCRQRVPSVHGTAQGSLTALSNLPLEGASLSPLLSKPYHIIRLLKIFSPSGMRTIICYRLLQFHEQPLWNSWSRSHEPPPLQMGLYESQLSCWDLASAPRPSGDCRVAMP